jgi:hypothetical protein
MNDLTPAPQSPVLVPPTSSEPLSAAAQEVKDSHSSSGKHYRTQEQIQLVTLCWTLFLAGLDKSLFKCFFLAYAYLH